MKNISKVSSGYLKKWFQMV